MDFSRELLFSFSALGVCNGLVLAVYFFFFARPKHSSHTFLGFLLLFLSIRIGKSVFYYFSDDLSGVFIQIGLTACWLLGPFLYFYIRYAIAKQPIKKPFWAFHLLLLFPLAVLTNVTYPWYEFRSIWWHYFIPMIHIQWLAYLIASGVLLWNTFWTKNRDQSNPSFKIWILSIYFGNAAIWLAYNLSSYTSYLVGAITFSLVFYLLLLLILLTKKRKSLLLLHPPMYGATKVEDEEAKRIIKRLNIMMTTDLLFKDPNLSLKDMAKKLGIQPNRLSQILNMNMNKSFPNILGEYRIEEAKKMILEKPNYAIESIGYECGFNSKSSFYNVFKKHTGMTPSMFKKTTQT